MITMTTAMATTGNPRSGISASRRLPIRDSERSVSMRIVAQASSYRWWRTNERSVHDGAADAELAKGLCPATSSRMPSSLDNRESRRSCGADTGVPSARGFGALGWRTLVRSSSVSSTLQAEPLERDSLLCEVRLYQFAPPDKKRRTLVLTRNSPRLSIHRHGCACHSHHSQSAINSD